MTVRRYCFLTTFYPPFNFGGDGIGVQRLARALARRGNQVTVIHDMDAYASLHTGPLPQSGGADPFGVQVVTLSSRLPIVSALLTQQFGRPVVNGARLHRLVDGRFDVVTFHNISLIGGPGLLAYGEGAARLYVAHEHWLVCPTHVLWRHRRERCDGRECIRCQLEYRRPPQLWRYTGLLERHLDQVDAFIAMSEFSRAKHREFGFAREMEVLPYFMPDPDSASASIDESIPHERPYFLFVGRLERIKGLQEVIPLFTTYSDADLLVAGEGEYGAELRRLAAGNPRVRFVGRVPANRLAAYYRHAIAVVVPSVCFETFGNILVEAFSYATPVIARRVGPFPELVQQSNGGLLFDTRDELMDAMRSLQSSPDLRAQMGRAGFEAYIAHWSESAVVPRYLDIVDRVLEQRARVAH